MPLTDTDRIAIEVMREQNVLQDVTASKLFLPGNPRLITIFCFDGLRAHDHMNYHERLWKECHGEGEAITCAIKLGGGALRLLPDFPVLTPSSLTSAQFAEVFMSEVRLAVEVMETEAFALYNHVPCSAARRAGYSFYKVVEGLLAAKQRIKMAFPNAQVAPLIHIDRDVKKRAYFLDREGWDSRREQYKRDFWPEEQQ